MDQTSAASARLQQSWMTPIVQPFLPCGLINPLLVTICLFNIDQYLFLKCSYFLKSCTRSFFFLFSTWQSSLCFCCRMFLMVQSISRCLSYSKKRQRQKVMVFIFAVGNHHSGTYDSRQAQGPGTMHREPREPLPVVLTWSLTHTHTHTHARTHTHTHTCTCICKHT